MSTPDELAAAADRIYGRLRAGLAVFFGPTGFDALWGRAMFLAHGAPLPGVHDAAAPTMTLPPGVPTVVGEGDTVAARETMVASFANFISLLFTFVGAPLGRSLLGQLWPAMLVRAPDPHTGEITQ